MGKLNHDEDIDISCNEYNRGYMLYAFNLTADLSKDDHFSLVKHGNLHLAMKFSESLLNTVMVITYMKFNNMIKVDCNRNMVLDIGV